MEQTKNFEGGETVCFKGYVAQYGKSAHNIDYTIKGIKELVAFNPNLILENDFAQSVYNLHDAHHTQKEIATLLGVNINKVYDMSLNTENTYTPKIRFHATPYALLSADDIAIATAKGWAVQAG